MKTTYAMENESLYLFLKNYLRLEGYQFNAQELKIQLLGHPSYPSLHSLTGVLTHLGIDNVAAQLDVTAEMLQQLPDRFLCTLNNASNLFMVSKQKEGVQVSDFDKDAITFSNDEFLRSWSGIAVLLSNEQEFNSQTTGSSRLFQYRYLIFLITGCTVFFLHLPSWQLSAHFLLSVLGLFVSYLFVRQEFGDASPFLKKICGNESDNGCSAVLDSAGSMLFKYIKLSDLSGAYFTSLILLEIAHYYISLEALPLLALLSLLVLPITLYSIYYQGFILKTWCRLCLMAVGILWVQSAILYNATILFLDMSLLLEQLPVILFIFLAGTFCWYVARKSLTVSAALRNEKMMANKFRRNFNVFEALLNRNTKIPVGIENPKAPELVFGSPSAPLQLLLITNPLCQYCKQAHKEVEALYLKNTEAIQLVVRFNVATTAPANEAYKVSKRVLELYQNNVKEAFNALGEVFGESSPLEDWLKKWGNPKAGNLDIHQLLEQQREWCFGNGFDFTPAFLVNGLKYPDEYQRDEFVFFIDELIEQTANVNEN